MHLLLYIRHGRAICNHISYLAHGGPGGVIIIVGVLVIAIIVELVQSKWLPLEALKRAICAKVVVGILS